MKHYFAFIFVYAFLFSSAKADAQICADTVQARKYQALGDKYYNVESLDS
jgi:hypothetical protein